MNNTLPSRFQAITWQAMPVLALAIIILSASLPAPAATAPVVTITPSRLDFGAVKVGQSASSSVTVANSGTATLQTSLIRITGSQSSQFTS